MPVARKITQHTQVLLEQAAVLRVAGMEWTEVAATMGRAHNTITKYPCLHPAEWAEATERARTERLGELWDKAMCKAYKLLDSGDENVVAKAVQSSLSHVAAMRTKRIEVDDVTDRRLESLSDDELRERAYRGVIHAV